MLRTVFDATKCYGMRLGMKLVKAKKVSTAGLTTSEFLLNRPLSIDIVTGFYQSLTLTFYELSASSKVVAFSCQRNFIFLKNNLSDNLFLRFFCYP